MKIRVNGKMVDLVTNDAPVRCEELKTVTALNPSGCNWSGQVAISDDGRQSYGGADKPLEGGDVVVIFRVKPHTMFRSPDFAAPVAVIKRSHVSTNRIKQIIKDGVFDPYQ